MSGIETEDVQVQCYSGHTYAERPTSFIYWGEVYEVEKTEKQWREPGMRYFQVITGDRNFFELCYNECNDDWSVKELGRKE
ncbi:hypothetical protein ACFLT3_01695 [Chloroflexota bacterium]